MCVSITFKDLWTYNIKVPPNKRKSSDMKISISHLNESEYTHVHGEMEININGKILPSLGIDSIDDVCFGYWIEMFSNLFKVFEMDETEYIIEGGEQGKPA